MCADLHKIYPVEKIQEEFDAKIKHWIKLAQQNATFVEKLEATKFGEYLAGLSSVVKTTWDELRARD